MRRVCTGRNRAQWPGEHHQLRLGFFRRPGTRRTRSQQLLAVNDFEAISWALPELDRDDLLSVGGDRTTSLPAHGTVVVLGPGTGLGVSALQLNTGDPIVFATEGGHVGLAPGDDEEMEVLRCLQQRFGRVSYERVLSGQGLSNLYSILCALDDRESNGTSPEEITRAALSGKDDMSVRAVRAVLRTAGRIRRRRRTDVRSLGWRLPGRRVGHGADRSVAQRCISPALRGQRSFLTDPRVRPDYGHPSIRPRTGGCGPGAEKPRGASFAIRLRRTDSRSACLRLAGSRAYGSAFHDSDLDRFAALRVFCWGPLECAPRISIRSGISIESHQYRHRGGVWRRDSSRVGVRQSTHAGTRVAVAGAGFRLLALPGGPGSRSG